MRFLTAFTVLVSAAAWAPLSAQVSGSVEWDPARLYASRAELQDLLSRYEAVLESEAYSGEFRSDAERSAERIRTRLREGDFRPGDRISLRIQGVDLPSDTLVVEPGPSVFLENMGRIPLDGVLRSELRDHMREELSRYVNDPVIQVQSMIRLSIQGRVGRPGFYVLPADMLLGEVLMRAGGPAQDADLEELRIVRANEPIMEGRELQEAIAEGRTLDQLSLRAGDQLVVPQETGNRLWSTLGRYALMLGSVLFFGVRLF